MPGEAADVNRHGHQTQQNTAALNVMLQFLRREVLMEYDHQ